MVRAGSRGELVGLTASVGVGQGVARAVSGLGRNDAVGALNEVHEVRLDVACATVALSVKTDRNHAGEEAVVVGFLDGSFVIGLLRWVAVLGAFVGHGNHDLRGVGVPAVVGLGGWVAWHVAGSVLPREARPVGSWAPVFTRVAGVGVAIVDGTGQLADAAGVITGGLSEWRGSWAGVLVVALTVAGAGRTGEGVAKTIDGLVHRHVAFFEHGFDALEVGAAGKVTTVNHGANVSPFRIHRTGGVDDEGQLNLAATGVVPCDLNVVVGVNDHVGVALVTDDGCQEGVVKEGDNGTGADVRLNHGVVDLRLVEETAEFVVVVLPHDVNVVLAVDIEGGPVSVLRAARDDGVIDGRDGSVVGCHAVHGCGPRREGRVHDGVLTGFIGPNNVNAVVLVNGEIGVPNLVESGVGDLGRIDQRFATGRNHRVVQVEVVARPHNVHVAGAVRANRCLLVG